ncbi:hypothetical protein LOK49_LG11G02579 [Camellia lanceoleosa]|uniref:Uncharacterized protein n=1 Tax=Camellia lanceoleosa TaxID=1840588 RepID=A0ACC0G1A4_9ERIC|nr:hypothetical protein LOK49_LG11G02579 [Camellia lanceoleosa]
MLKNAIGSYSSTKESLIYSYGRSFNGFAANLTEDQVATISEMEGVISVIPNQKLNLHTTRSWDFMNFNKDKVGGIWPEADSFNDECMDPPPAKWKGECQGANFTCNKYVTVVSFSSSGPNPFNPDVLKPDITAPGVDILAAWSSVAPPAIYDGHSERKICCLFSTKYNVISGTSMSCPHASAYVMDRSKIVEDLEFDYGSGHINPVGAIDPGLVFDLTDEADYIDVLCKQGYDTSTLRLVTGDNSTCNVTTQSLEELGS